MPRGVPLDLTGQRFGLWTVESRAGVTEAGQVTWRCLCECGAVALVPARNLRSGRSKGCRACYLRRVTSG